MLNKLKNIAKRHDIRVNKGFDICNYGILPLIDIILT